MGLDDFLCLTSGGCGDSGSPAALSTPCDMLPKPGVWEAMAHGSFVIQGSHGRVLETEANTAGIRCLNSLIRSQPVIQ